MKDTKLNRLRAIHSIAAIDGEPISWAVLGAEKMSARRLRERLKEADKALSHIYNLAHGGLSKCCAGRGSELIEPAIAAYEGGQASDN